MDKHERFIRVMQRRREQARRKGVLVHPDCGDRNQRWRMDVEDEAMLARLEDGWTEGNVDTECRDK